MQQTCSRCGYVSDRPARFCRQCGSQLFAENDVTSATTRNYSQQPAQFIEQQSADYTPGFSAASYSPGAWNDQTPNTARLYQAPVAPQYQYPAVEPKQSFSWGKWILISFATFLLLSILAGGALFWWGKQAIERAIERAEAGNSEPVVVNVPPIPEIPPPPPGASSSESAAVSLESLKYPGSAVIESKKAPFTEVMKMTTKDDLETVKQYYDKKFGEIFKTSATSIQNADEEKYVYMSLTHPMVTIEIEPDSNDNDKTRISIAKVTAPIPKIILPKELQQK